MKKVEDNNIVEYPTVTEKSPVTSPFSSMKLVSKVNSLVSGNANFSSYPQIKSANNEKKELLDYEYVVKNLMTCNSFDDLNEFYSNIYKIITGGIESEFMAVGLYREKSNCINLRLQDKLGNVYSTKVFLKDRDNPIVQAFDTKQVIYNDDVSFLKLAYFRQHPAVIIPMISVNKCIGVMIFADSNAIQNVNIYNLISNYTALIAHNSELMETSDAYVNTDTLTLLHNHRGFQEILSNKSQEQRSVSKSFLF